VHANYWLSGVAGHRVKHALGVPLVSTFHTLARGKAETGDPEPDQPGSDDALLRETFTVTSAYPAERRAFMPPPQRP